VAARYDDAACDRVRIIITTENRDRAIRKGSSIHFFIINRSRKN